MADDISIPAPPSFVYDPVDGVVEPKETAHGEQETDNQSRQKSENENGDVRFQGGENALGVQERPESDGPQAGDRDRPETVGPGQEEILAVVRQDVERKAEEAQRRDLLNQPYRVRVHLRDGRGGFVDFTCVVPWPQWLQWLQSWRGVAHDKGYVPLESISYIVHLDAAGKPEEMGENVVSFRRPL